MESITQLFDHQKANALRVKQSSVKERKAKLRRLRISIQKHEQEIFSALKADLRKSEFESAVFEVNVIYAEIKFALDNLQEWMEPLRVYSNKVNMMTCNRILYEPKGVCLIISPWNYPFQLTLSPLVSAIAAGNCCILKPSELSPETSKAMGKIIKSTFEENEVALIEGDADVATALLSKPFDHIFFTGSTNIGKVVMKAAAANLSTVTLELGGKSPVIIDEHVNLKKAAEKIAWGKWANAGQTCIAPDYIFVPTKLKEEFITLAKASIEKLYLQENKQLNKEDYGRIISPRHYNRLKELTEEALQKGGKAELGGTFTETDLTIAPTILSGVDEDARIMKEEIFGPILPVKTYENIQEALDYINANEKPLALYVFSSSKKTVRTILKKTSSGGVCVNDVLIHLTNPYIPFGGAGASGMGGSHGFFGFKAFSHERGIMYQNRFIDFGKIIYPPYKGKGWVMRVIRRLM